jgi:hypothetical protein
MNAQSLMKGANIAALATTIVSTVAKTAAKAIAGTTIAPIAVGGGIMMGALRALQSESFAGGVRLIARRSQAKIGLGSEYERAQTSSDFLAGAYGFDRSTTLSSINVLSGMGVGGTARKLTTGEATGLTKVGGLISQQSGVPFERVMTNIQQLLVQTTPHVRDIREMLNQAPILGKFALKDMEEQGVKGVDVRTWLKDSGNIMSALKQFELSLATNAGMQARGQIGLAQQDFWGKIAGNDPFWQYVGRSGSSLIGAGGNAVDAIMTTLSGNDAFKVMVAHIETIFDGFGKKGGTFIDKLIGLVDALAQRFGLDVGDSTAARTKVGRVNAITDYMSQPDVQAAFLKEARQAGIFKDYTAGTEGMLKAEAKFLRGAEDAALDDPNVMENTVASGIFRRKMSAANAANTDVNPVLQAVALFAANRGIGGFNRDISEEAFRTVSTDSTHRYVTKDALAARKGNVVTPVNEAAYFDLAKSPVGESVSEYIKDITATGTYDPRSFGGGGEAQGKDITGFNKDRRALEIHFNAPIVEWTNTMETTSPQETVDAVAESLEQLASAAIQKALLGASNKMSSRWY